MYSCYNHHHKLILEHFHPKLQSTPLAAELVPCGASRHTNLLWPPLPGIAIKLSFSPSPKILSSRFYLAMGWILATLSPRHLSPLVAISFSKSVTLFLFCNKFICILFFFFFKIRQIFLTCQSQSRFFFFSSFCFLGLNLWHMEVPRLGVKSEL